MTQPHAETLFGAPYETLAQKYRPVFQRIRDTALQREHKVWEDNFFRLKTY